MHKTDIDGVGVEKRCHIVAAYDGADNCRDSIGGQVVVINERKTTVHLWEFRLF